jgi:membrane protein
MSLFKLFKQILAEFSHDKAGQLSAAFAYVATFSLGPLLLVIISVVGFIFGQKAVEGTLFSQLSGTLGPSTARTLQTVVAHSHRSAHSSLALILGAIGLALGAAGLTSQLQNSFNAIFNAVPDPKSGIKRTLYVKIKNILIVVIGGIAAMASLISSALIIGLAKKVQTSLGIPAFSLEIIDNILSLLVFVLILYFVYQVIPDIRIPRKIAFTASLYVSLLFMVGKLILGIIIGRNSTASAYGAAASLVTLLLWIYYTGQILFIGAEGIKVYGLNHALVYEAKKFNLKRSTITIDSKGRKAGILEAYMRGVRKNQSKK